MAQVTLQNVAEKAGVSIKTVSRVLNNEPNVAPLTAEKIRTAIAELKYVPNIAARNLSSGKAMTIGLVVGWPVTSPFSSALIEATLKASVEHRYRLALFTIENNVANQIVEAFLGKQVDGVILDTNAAEIQELTQQIEQLHIPCLIVHPNCINDRPKKFSMVRIENVESARQAVAYLIQLGHRNIGSVGYNSNLTQEDERLQGYHQALREAGIRFKEGWIHRGIGLPNPVAMKGTLDLLTHHPEITAIFAASDEMATGTLGAIWKLGLRVPEDISVIGFDDIPYATMAVPPLTTIRQPIGEIGSLAIKHLIEIIDNPAAEQVDIIVPTELIIRDSCRPPRNGTHP